jgi:hypothetical protein
MFEESGHGRGGEGGGQEHVRQGSNLRTILLPGVGVSGGGALGVVALSLLRRARSQPRRAPLAVFSVHLPLEEGERRGA